jgi:hypothetical protein
MRPKEKQKSEPFLMAPDFDVPLYTIVRGVIQPWWSDSAVEHDEFGFVYATKGS